MDISVARYPDVPNKNLFESEWQSFQSLNDTETAISTGNVDQFGPSAT